ncbi:MAG TPA: hypothetical protein VGN97_20305 [Mesorhizobium sp.]|jgi:hypothetical protein|nr:hypothetical protein [Mesorhizobium sp.]
MSAKILPFTPRVKDPEGHPDAAAPRGVILLFTGVRYERLPDAPAAKAARVRKPRQRRAAPAV